MGQSSKGRTGEAAAGEEKASDGALTRGPALFLLGAVTYRNWQMLPSAGCQMQKWQRRQHPFTNLLLSASCQDPGVCRLESKAVFAHRAAFSPSQPGAKWAFALQGRP